MTGNHLSLHFLFQIAPEVISYEPVGTATDMWQVFFKYLLSQFFHQKCAQKVAELKPHKYSVIGLCTFEVTREVTYGKGHYRK